MYLRNPPWTSGADAGQLGRTISMKMLPVTRANAADAQADGALDGLLGDRAAPEAGDLAGRGSAPRPAARSARRSSSSVRRPSSRASRRWTSAGPSGSWCRRSRGRSRSLLNPAVRGVTLMNRALASFCPAAAGPPSVTFHSNSAEQQPSRASSRSAVATSTIRECSDTRKTRPAAGGLPAQVQLLQGQEAEPAQDDQQHDDHQRRRGPLEAHQRVGEGREPGVAEGADRVEHRRPDRPASSPSAAPRARTAPTPRWPPARR